MVPIFFIPRRKKREGNLQKATQVNPQRHDRLEIRPRSSPFSNLGLLDISKKFQGMVPQLLQSPLCFGWDSPDVRALPASGGVRLRAFCDFHGGSGAVALEEDMLLLKLS